MNIDAFPPDMKKRLDEIAKKAPAEPRAGRDLSDSQGFDLYQIPNSVAAAVEKATDGPLRE